MQLRITIVMCMVEIRNRKTLQSKVNICKSDVKIGDYADSLVIRQRIIAILVFKMAKVAKKYVIAIIFTSLQ